jgi:predicted membrane channel-forming protein YqfA (hemolysin III family)
MNQKAQTILFVLGAGLILISAVLVMEHVSWGKYTFAVGTAFYILNRLRRTYTGSDFRVKRLERYNVVNAILLVVSSYLQFKGKNAWVVLLFLVALLELFISLRLSWYEKQAAAGDGEQPSEQQPG